jgi:hypothetical protein
MERQIEDTERWGCRVNKRGGVEREREREIENDEEERGRAPLW